MARTLLPWFINRIEYVYSPNCQAGLPDGRYVLAVCSPYWALGLDRFRAAWWVFTGRAHAFKWPEPGDLEYTLRLTERAKPTPLSSMGNKDVG